MKTNNYMVKLGIIIALMGLLCQPVFSQFKVIGYLPTWGDINSVDYTKLTHINVSFANPDGAGNLDVPAGLSTIVQRGHANNVKVLISLGGANAPHATWHNLMSDANRASFVTRIAQYVQTYQLDGVDVDLEGGAINGDYEKFIVDLSARIKPAGKLLTFAIATWQGGQISNRALAEFDLVNVMSYDHTGPWTAGNPGQHSPYSQSVSEINYWVNTRGVAKEKVILGVPFYGWRFGNPVEAMTFSQIVNAYPGSENADQWNTGNGTVYYNGIPTIKSKTTLAMNQAGGIMIWQILQDASGSRSLLTAINETARGGNTPPTVSLTAPANNTTIAAGSSLTISANASDANGTVTRVEFYSNGSKIGEDATAPYSISYAFTSAGTYSITARATDNAGATASSSAVSVTVNPVVTQSPYGGSARPIPGRIEAEHYDLGGQGVAFNDVTTANQGGSFRTEAVDVEPCSDAGTGFNIGYVVAGEWVEYTVNVTPGTYTLEARVAAIAAGNRFHIEIDGQNISGTVTVPNTGAWQNWQTVSVTTTALTGGVKVMRVVMDMGDFNLNHLTFAAPSNKAPSVSISSPVANASFTAPASITIAASASDQDGTISKVDFYNGSIPLGTDLTAPYSLTWNNVAAGTYTITARATDNAGAVTTSSAVTFTVTPVTVNQPPVVSIASPLNNANYNAPANITITASASDPEGALSKVDFFNGSTLIGSDLTSPYSIVWNNIGAGTYSITARATDNQGAIATSTVITVVVKTVVENKPPVVSLTSPIANASFTAPATISIAANASDADGGSIVKVEFYNGSVKIGEKLTAPYTYSWTNVAAGTYTITARAFDNGNAFTNSAAVSVVVKSIVNDPCASLPLYKENGGYVAGSKVKNGGRQFECKPWPYSGWCNGAAWAYGPGTGMYWSDAWIDKGACTSAKTSANINDNSSSEMITVIPNPVVNELSLNTEMDLAGGKIQIINAIGITVLNAEAGVNTLNVSTLPSGMYTLVVIKNDQVVSTQFIK